MSFTQRALRYIDKYFRKGRHHYKHLYLFAGAEAWMM